MESDGDFEQLSPAEGSLSPVPRRRLKRLKKVKQIAEVSPRYDAVGFDKLISGDLEELDFGSAPASVRLEEEGELRSVFGVVGGEEDEIGAKKALDFDSMAEDFGGEGGVGGDEMETGEQSGDLGMDESPKKRRVLDGTEESSREKKKKRKHSMGFEELPISYASMNMTKKERREHLDQLRAENQRLLRETRDAAFKPVPIVQKPISSVLEKIRRRKLEVSKKFLGMSGGDGVYKEVSVDVENKEVTVEVMKNEIGIEMTGDEVTAGQNSLGNSNVDGTSSLEKHSSHETDYNPSHGTSSSKLETNAELDQVLRAPTDDTQDLSSDSQMSNSKDELLEKTPNSPLEEVMTPSILAMNLRLNSSPLHDDSSEEEGNDKENLDPCHNSSPTGDPVRAFVDEEAEEEDDSDNDLLRFKDDEEDEDEEDEELRDMIVSQFKENPDDSERRNELHQKWLEQQDAVGTEKLLQKLKCGLQENETSLLEEGEDGEDEEEKLESDEEDGEDLRTANATRMTIKKIKEMIPLMFTDKDDVYLSSDEEEVEKKLAKECLYNNTAQKAKLFSPTKDKSSKELFCRIKKVNNVPDNGKRTKTSATSDKLLIGGKKTIASKFSFLGRGQKNSLPPSHKRGSIMARSFIFERDDGNSKSSISTAEESSDTIQLENHRLTRPSAKFSNSQAKQSSQSKIGSAETSSRTPLYEILKRSSVQVSRCTSDAVISHTESIFAAFKLEKKSATRNDSIKSL